MRFDLHSRAHSHVMLRPLVPLISLDHRTIDLPRHIPVTVSVLLVRISEQLLSSQLYCDVIDCRDYRGPW